MTAPGVRWITRDIEALPKNEGIRYGLIDGELLVTRSPHHCHQHLAGRIFSLLDQFFSINGH